MTRQIAVDIYTFKAQTHPSKYDHEHVVIEPSLLVSQLKGMGLIAYSLESYADDGCFAIQWFRHSSAGRKYNFVFANEAGGMTFVYDLRVDVVARSMTEIAALFREIEYQECYEPHCNLVNVLRISLLNQFRRAIESDAYDELALFGDRAYDATLPKLQNGQYAVYRLHDVSTATIGYIGITNNPQSRYNQHLNSAIPYPDMARWIQYDESVTSSKELWLGYVIATHKTLRMEVLEVFDNKADATNRERELIHQYLAAGEPLTNSQLYGAIRTSPCPYEADRLLWRQRLLGY